MREKLVGQIVHSQPAHTLREKSLCPIVGIGASAGGLEALELFFGNLPPNSGLAFVVVQHMDPTHKALLVELLQRCTSLPVVQVSDRMQVEADHIYVIPPNQDLSILHGVLHLLEPAAIRGLRLPINSFFRSLADDQQEHAIGVILSGMGTDGTLGLRAIKEKSGAVFVQDPQTARFDSMPRSAVVAGLADVVAPVEELAGKIIDYLQITPRPDKRSELDRTDTDQSGLQKVILILRSRTGQDFTHYKKNTLYRRIERRMGLHQLPRLADYVRYLRENAQEAELLFKELLIGVTSFFRDPDVWEQLKNEAIPGLLATHPEGAVFRAWTTGCATGEEAYSLAMVFQEVLEEQKPAAHFSLQIFATDLDKQAVDVARLGCYPAKIVADVGETRLRHFFTKDERGYWVNKEIREMITFAPQNLVMDPPFTRLDLLTCRNLLIYLESDMQKKLLPLFNYCLNPGGILVLGNSETAGQNSDYFAPLPGRSRIYRQLNTGQRPELADFPTIFTQPKLKTIPFITTASGIKMPANNLKTLIESILLQVYSPAAVLINNEGDILYISGKTGKYLEPAIGKANLNIFAMAREGLGNLLMGAIARAARDQVTVRMPGVRIGSNDGLQIVDLTVQPLADSSTSNGALLIVFSDVSTQPEAKEPAKARRGRLPKAQLAEEVLELQRTREDMQSIHEEMQTSQEELRSLNEEMQSANEELQSSNEELTTSKEEMQSMNEELQTVNRELQSKVDELALISDDMNNLLERTDIATLFLDANLRVRRFTSQTARIMKLIPSDVGRPFTDLVSDLDYPNLAQDA
ncbi:MAG: chemotaxis protein CheB, partial [Chloroflexota bacterium]